jgi:omega-amidase
MKLSYRPLVLWITSSSAYTVKSSPGWIPRSKLSQSQRYASSSSSLKMSSSTDASSWRVALCQFPVTHTKEINHATVKEYLQKAKEQGAQMAVLPEIWNSPYATAAFPEYAEKMPDIGDKSCGESPSSELLKNLSKEHSIWIVGGSIPERTTEDGKEKIYNTCLVFDPEGNIVAKHRKVHLFDIDVPGGITFFESETLSPGQTVSVFQTPVGNFGLGICYDIRFAEYAMLLRQKHECLVLVYPGAFNMTTGPAHWELLQRSRALDNQCYVLTASPARSTEADATSKYPHYTAWGHSTCVSPWGNVVATTDEKAGIVMCDLDMAKVEEVRKGIPIGSQRRADMYKLDQV